MKKGIGRAVTSLNVNEAYSIVYSGLTYALYGLKTIFDVYKVTGAAGTYSCITQFGEQVTVSHRDGKWIDTFTGQQTITSQAIGAAIESKARRGVSH